MGCALDTASVITSSGSIEYSKLVKIENANELSSALAERIGPKFVDPFATRNTNESLIPYLSYLVTARSAELIQSLYAEDFETFDYSEHPPDTKEAFSADQFKLAIKAIEIIRGRHQRLGEMCRQTVRFNQAIVERDGAIAERDGVIAERDRVIAEHSQMLHKICASLSWRLTKPLRFAARLLREPKSFFTQHHK